MDSADAARSAFDIGDVEEAAKLLPAIRTEAAAKWQFTASLDDLAVSLGLQKDLEVKAGLSEVLNSLQDLTPGAK